MLKTLFSFHFQAGPVDYVTRPKDRPFAFVVFEHEESVPYSIALLKGVQLFGRNLDMRPRDGTEQARRISYYMDEVRQKKRQAASEFGDNRRSYGGGGGASMYQPDLRVTSSFNLAYGQGQGADREVTLFGSSSRSVSWPKLPMGGGHWDTPPMPLIPPPPPPPMGMMPRRSDHDDRDHYDYSRKRGHDDRRSRGYPDDQDDYRSLGNDRDNRNYQSNRSRSPDRSDQRGRYNRGSNRK